MSQVTRIGVERELELVVARDHPNPHHVLGAHQADGGAVVRVYRPNASAPRVGRKRYGSSRTKVLPSG